MNRKYIQISDLYFKVMHLCDCDNGNENYGRIIHTIFKMLVNCTLKRYTWEYSDYITLKDATLIKEQFDKLMKIFFKGVIKHDAYN